MPARAAVITVLVMDRPMCLDCIAEKARMPQPEAEAYLTEIAAGVAVRRDPEDRCRGCGMVTTVFSISRQEN
jgi:hypothetical protein